MNKITTALAIFVLACSGDDESQSRADSLDASAETEADGADDTAPIEVADGETGPGPDDTASETTEEEVAPPDTTTAETDSAEEVADGGPDGGGWLVDPDGPWVLGRPIAITGSESAAQLGPPVAASGRYQALVGVRVATGPVVADGQTYSPPDGGAHAAVAALSGDVSAARLGTLVYLDGDLSAPNLPLLAVCDGWVYATITEQGGAHARFVRLDANLETIDVALLSARPGLGNTVALGPPVCGGPGVVATLDAVGGAIFTAPDGRQSEFGSDQTDNRSLILNGARVFNENAAQVVSATSMRILHLARGPEQVLFYVAEATVERQIGNTTLMPGDQLVYSHDFAVGSGGSISSQAWFGRQDIQAIATSPDGRFAVVWTDVIAGPTPADPETIETVVSVFEADGARAWSTRSSGWAIDRVVFGGDGDLRVAGRFRSLEAIGIARAPVGPEDAFLVVFAGVDGARKRFVTHGADGLGARIVGPIMRANGSAACAPAELLDVVLVATGDVRTGIGVSDEARCATEDLTAGDNDLGLAVAAEPGADDAVDLWLSLVGGAISAGDGQPWPPGSHAGALRARLVIPR